MACEQDCLSEQLDLLGRNPPLIALCSEAEGRAELEVREHPREEGLEPRKGREAGMTMRYIREPPVGWLSSLWEGQYG